MEKVKLKQTNKSSKNSDLIRPPSGAKLFINQPKPTHDKMFKNITVNKNLGTKK
jgi:hypothetical protein